MFTKRSDAQCLMFNHIYPHYLLQLRTWYDQAPGAPPGVYIVTLCLFIISWTPWHGLIITMMLTPISRGCQIKLYEHSPVINLSSVSTKPWQDRRHFNSLPLPLWRLYVFG